MDGFCTNDRMVGTLSLNVTAWDPTDVRNYDLRNATVFQPIVPIQKPASFPTGDTLRHIDKRFVAERPVDISRPAWVMCRGAS